MTIDQLAAWLASLFEDPDGPVFSGWVEGYNAGDTMSCEGEIHFGALAVAIAEKLPFEIHP